MTLRTQYKLTRENTEPGFEFTLDSIYNSRDTSGIVLFVAWGQ